MGVLYARVGGAWVPISSNANEVYISNNATPPTDPSTELWVVSDADSVSPLPVATPNAGNALGIVAMGVPVSRAGVSLSTTTPLGPAINYTTTLNRRYRLVANGIRASSAAAAAYVAFRMYGGGITGNVDWYRLVSTAYDSLNAEVVFTGTGVASSYNCDMVFGAAVSVWTEPESCGFYLEDVGPVSRVSPVDPLAETAVPWIALPLASGWSNYGGGFMNAGYRKIHDRVELRGLITGGASGNLVDNTTVATLPAGYRPLNTAMLLAPNTGGPIRVDVNPTGTVNLRTAAGGGGGAGTATVLWTSLDPLSWSIT